MFAVLLPPNPLMTLLDVWRGPIKWSIKSKMQVVQQLSIPTGAESVSKQTKLVCDKVVIVSLILHWRPSLSQVAIEAS